MSRLTAYIAAALRAPLPEVVLEKAKHHFLDTLASIISGARMPPSEKVLAYARTMGQSDQATVIGASMTAAAVDAALINGMLAHADETDDPHAAPLTPLGHKR